MEGVSSLTPWGAPDPRIRQLGETRRKLDGGPRAPTCGCGCLKDPEIRRPDGDDPGLSREAWGHPGSLRQEDVVVSKMWTRRGFAEVPGTK